MTVKTTLSKSLTVVPAQEAKTTSEFYVTWINENYGWGSDENRFRGPGHPNSVEAEVVLSEDPPVSHRLTVWEGDAYLAVRGTWTDETLYARIKEILEA